MTPRGRKQTLSPEVCAATGRGAVVDPDLELRVARDRDDVHAAVGDPLAPR